MYNTIQVDTSFTMITMSSIESIQHGSTFFMSIHPSAHMSFACAEHMQNSTTEATSKLD